MTKGSEAIELLGKQMYEGFSIQNCYEIYRQVYDIFVKGCNGENKGKGILVIGPIGVGKSAMMKILQRLFKDTVRKFRWVKSSDLRDMIEEYTLPEIKEMYGKKCLYDLYIDDIGLAGSQKNYGNVVNVISEIIMDRYELFVESGYRTHFSSNLIDEIKDNINNDATLETVFGARVVDRMKEMCEMIIWEGDSLRK